MPMLTDITSIEFKIGNGVTTPFIDLHSSGQQNNYDVRLTAVGGASAAGQGSFLVLANSIVTNATVIIGTTSISQSVMTTVTQPSTDNTTNVATTAFVVSKAGAYLPLTGGTLTGALVTVGLTVSGVTNMSGGNVVWPGSGNNVYITGEPNFAYGGTFTDPEPGIPRDAKFGQDGVSVWGGVFTDILNVRGTTGSGSVINTFANAMVSMAGNTTNVTATGITTITPPTTSNGSNVATTAWVNSVFGSAVGSLGYQKHPGGMIIQWGVGTLTAGSYVASFPLTWPGGAYSIVATRSGATAAGTFTVAVGTPTTTGVTFYGLTNTQTYAINWIAIGH